MKSAYILLLLLAIAACTSKPVTPSYSLQTNPVPGQHFTLGSLKDEVLNLHGAPTGIITFRNGDEWWDYGVSHVYFRNGRVNGWDSSHLEPEPLKAYISSNSNANSFGQGSTMDDLVSAMGTPTGVRELSSGLIWVHYGKSRVDVRNGIVTGWDDRMRILKLAPRQ